MIQKKSLGMNLLRSVALAAFTAVGSLSAQVIVAEPPADPNPEAYYGDDAATDGALDNAATPKHATPLLEDNYDLNALIVDSELYIWNRIADVFDIIRMGIGGGVGVGAELSLTQYATLGASATHYQQGVDFPHCIPPLWLINYYDKTPVLNYHTTGSNYVTAAIGPWRYENVSANTIPDFIFPRDTWDIRAEVNAGVLSVYANISARQIGDFFAGFIGLDPMKDDDEVDPYTLRFPADQFGRGFCNIVFGIFEVPFNVLRVTEEEGDLPGLSKGLGLGVWRFVCREVVGVVELVTFPFGWQPIIEPEYVFQKKRGVIWRVNRPSFHKLYR